MRCMSTKRAFGRSFLHDQFPFEVVRTDHLHQLACNRELTDSWETVNNDEYSSHITLLISH